MLFGSVIQENYCYIHTKQNKSLSAVCESFDDCSFYLTGDRQSVAIDNAFNFSRRKVSAFLIRLVYVT